MSAWSECRFLTCSVLPVARACQCTCAFCFSHSSVSALPRKRTSWSRAELRTYYRWARERGATRLVVTGGGEPLLATEQTLEAVSIGRELFSEITCFTNAIRLDPEIAKRLADAGITYLCWSRHHWDDEENRRIMGTRAPTLAEVARAAGSLSLRATCVMHRGGVETAEQAWQYIETLRAFGIREFTFKHTYVAYERSLFRDSAQDAWCREHAIEGDFFAGQGQVVHTLPWGPRVRNIDGVGVCFYQEPTPAWELQNRLCRSSNLMADGSVYASLEDTQSRLFPLDSSPRRSLPLM